MIYAIAKDDPRAVVAEGLLASGGIVSMQVLNEFTATAHRRLGMPWGEITEALDTIRVLCLDPMPLTLALHYSAIGIAMRHGYHIYDALIVAAALHARCDILYSEDLQHGRVIDCRLTIRNRFAVSC